MRVPEIAFALCIAALPIASADARPNAKEARAKFALLQKAEKKFNRSYARLSEAEKESLLELLKGFDLTDSDDDGLPDAIEDSEGSNSCDNDSDDDGKNDGDEVEDGQKPGDPDSDDDGNLDGDEEESEGKITALNSATEFVVEGKTWIVTAQTEFERLSTDGLVVGACIEVEGEAGTGGKFIAKKIEKDRDC